MCIIFYYEFHQRTNAIKITQSVSEVFGKDVLMNIQQVSGLRSSNQAILIVKIKHVGDDDKATVKVDTHQTLHELTATFAVTIPTILNHLKQIGYIKKLETQLK